MFGRSEVGFSCKQSHGKVVDGVVVFESSFVGLGLGLRLQDEIFGWKEHDWNKICNEHNVNI